MPADVFSFRSEPPQVAYVDPSFFLNLFIRDSAYFEECKGFAEKLEERKTVLIMSNLGLDEIWYVLLKLLAVKDHGKGWQRKLDSSVSKEYIEEVEKYTTNLLEIPNLFFAEVSTRQTFDALGIMKDYGLLPRDAIHSSIVLSGIGSIITTDAGFVKVPKIKVYTCNRKALKNIGI
jgi:predicted nucleic acid-binding protein